jgi:hypothetical protein
VRAARLLVLVLVSTLANCRDNPLPTGVATVPAATPLRLKARLQRASLPNAESVSGPLHDPPHRVRR